MLLTQGRERWRGRRRADCSGDYNFPAIRRDNVFQTLQPGRLDATNGQRHHPLPGFQVPFAAYCQSQQILLPNATKFANFFEPATKWTV